MKGTALYIGAIAALATATYLFLRAGGKSSVPNAALKSPIFYRSAIARLYQYNTTTGLYTWTLPAQNLTSVTSMIQAFKPTFLHSVTRVEVGKASFPTQMITDLNSVYATMKSLNPACVVDIALRGSSYGTNIAGMVADMQATASSGLNFDSFSTYGLPTGDATPVFQQAQSLNKMLGTYGISPSAIPTGYTTSFQIFEDVGFQPLSHTSSDIWNTLGVPVLFLNQNGATIVTTVPAGFPAPSSGQTEHNYFVLSLTPDQQLQIITDFAQNQVSGGYGYSFPLVFPEGTIGIELDIIAQGIAPTINSLANQYNATVLQ